MHAFGEQTDDRTGRRGSQDISVPWSTIPTGPNIDRKLSDRQSSYRRLRRFPGVNLVATTLSRRRLLSPRVASYTERWPVTMMPATSRLARYAIGSFAPPGVIGRDDSSSTSNPITNRTRARIRVQSAPTSTTSAHRGSAWSWPVVEQHPGAPKSTTPLAGASGTRSPPAPRRTRGC